VKKESDYRKKQNEELERIELAKMEEQLKAERDEDAAQAREQLRIEHEERLKPLSSRYVNS
jgi:hypothetical protein